MMMIWSRVKCAWVAWTGTRAAWLALPAASALVISACVPVAGLLRDMPLSPAHRRPVTAASGSTHRHPVWIAMPPPEYVPVSSEVPYRRVYVPISAIIAPPPVFASPPVNVPEPSSGIILATGVLALMAFSRRIKND
jgi:hypothetical protein